MQAAELPTINVGGGRYIRLVMARTTIDDGHFHKTIFTIGDTYYLNDHMNFNSFSKESIRGVKEELYKDFLLSMLTPYIEKAIDEYYGYPKSFNLWDAKVLHLERLEPGSFYFEIIIQVTSFEGPHNPPYGLETVTIRKDYSGIRVIEFSHEVVK